MRPNNWSLLYCLTIAATAFAASCPASSAAAPDASPAVGAASGTAAPAPAASGSPAPVAASGSPAPAAATPTPPAASGSGAAPEASATPKASGSGAAPASASASATAKASGSGAEPASASATPKASGSGAAPASASATPNASGSGAAPASASATPKASGSGAPAAAASPAASTPKAASTAAPAASTPVAASTPAPAAGSSGAPEASPSSTPSSGGKVVGGVYLINNDISGNMILGHNILSDGSIQYARSTYAGGQGFADFTQPNGNFVALFSQASVQVHNGSLFTVNAASNTVAMFKINPEDPTDLTMVGNPVDSGGIFPVSVGLSRQTGNLCTINGGNQGSVACFTVSQSAGLVPIPNSQRTLGLNQTNPPIGPGFTVSQVMFTDNGSRLVAAVKGQNSTHDHGYLLTWDVKSDGSLSANPVKTSAGTGTEVFGMSAIPGTEAVLSSDPSSGYQIYDFTDSDTANVMPFFLPDQIDSCWTEWSTKTGSYYLSDRLATRIYEISIDANLFGSNVASYQLPANSSLLDISIASLPNNDYLYILGAGKTSIYTMALNSAGNAQVMQQYNITTPVTRSGVSVVGSNLAGMATYVIPQ